MSAARLLLVALLSLATLHAEEPFAFDKTPGKLPKDVVPRRYAVTVEPDVERATLRGRETIELDVRRPVRRIVLNSLGLTITRAVLHAGGETVLVPQLDPAQQTLAFDLERELPAGAATLELEWTGTLSEAPQGLYIARYQTGTETRRALATQMEATDARRMFPCWDEPVFRAKFALTAIVPKAHTALSNMPSFAETPLGNGRKEIAFAESQLRGSLLHTLGALGDPGVIAEAQKRFAAFLKDPRSLDGNLRSPVFTIVGRNADEAAYEQLHALGKREDGTEQKRTLYGALCHARTPELARKTLALALGEDLPPKESAKLVGRVASDAELPELAWEFARQNLDALLARLPAFSANDYVPGIFRSFTEAARADELEAFTKASLPPSVTAQVAKAADEIRFKAALKKRLPPEMDAWLRARGKH